MNKTLLLGLLLLIMAAFAYFYLSASPPSASNPPATDEPATSTPDTPASKDDLIVVDAPLPNASVLSPLTISGKARGQWYFEASFPVKIEDANGTVLGQMPVQAHGEWMTTEYVPFTAQLTFRTPTTPTGKLILEKDNPSGLPEHANQLEIPIRFANYNPNASGENTTAITLYYYNSSRDETQCSAQGLVAVSHEIPKTPTPLKDSIELLLKRELSASEKAQGLTSEFPLAGVSLKSAAIQNGVATLTFDDPQNKLSGGACRVSVLKAQIEATAKQFPSVQSVKFLPATLFQP